ncbi:hypothetical protein PLICRDRAFT_171553 [Plicaturopsis crispa FD-325 SS-3]|nr:hypothetical protein PLICRDRAFT_171553 [Plicaturopsis crispa FD-325 SS-3]
MDAAAGLKLHRLDATCPRLRPQHVRINQARRVAKIKGVTSAIEDHGCKSVNDFLLAFYTSQDAVVVQEAYQNLAFTNGKAFPPEKKILVAWLEHGHTGDSRRELHHAITRKTADVVVKESTAAYHKDALCLSSSDIDVQFLTADFGLNKIMDVYHTLLPCLWFLLAALLTAPNDYERWNGRKKQGKEEMVPRLVVVIITMLLFARNRATDAFQLVMGLFLSSAGASRRVIDTFNHMGVSVSYQTVQRSLVSLSKSARERATNFVQYSERMYGVVYDNINFTLRKASQRLDNVTQQLNAPTLAVFSLPKAFTRTAYAAALSVAERNKLAVLRSRMTVKDLRISKDQQSQLSTAFKHNVRAILLVHYPGLKKSNRNSKALRKHAKRLEPKICVLSSEKTEFFPLPALNQEEVSVHGTIKVVVKIFTVLLGLAQDVIDAELRLLVGVWLTICNLRLMKEERADELSTFARLNWVQEASMPFHF